MSTWTTFDNDLIAYWTCRGNKETWDRFNASFRSTMDWVSESPGGDILFGSHWERGGNDNARAKIDPVVIPGQPLGIFSVSMWVYNIQSGPRTGLRCSSNNNCPIRMNGSEDLGVRIAGTLYECGFNLTDEGIIEDAKWHHLVVTCEGATGDQNWNFYVDGDFVGAVGTDASGLITDPFDILCNGDSSAGQCFADRFAEIAIWGRALSSTEVKHIYDIGRFGRPLKELLPQTQLLDNWQTIPSLASSSWVDMTDNELLWHLTDKFQILTNWYTTGSSGNGFNGRIRNPPAFPLFPAGLELCSGSIPPDPLTSHGYSTFFSTCYQQEIPDPVGTGPYQFINAQKNATELSVGGEDDRTFMLWAKEDDPPPVADALGRYMWSMGVNAVNFGFSLRTVDRITDVPFPAGRGLEVCLGDSAETEHIPWTGPESKEWNHFAVVVRTESPGFSAVTLYINGASVLGPVFHSLNTSDFQNLRLGIGFDTGNDDEMWSGWLQEFAVFSRALTTQEILIIYNYQKPKSALEPVANLGPAGNSINDYLVWAWGWELNSTFYNGYLNGPVALPGTYFARDSDWVGRNWFPPNTRTAGSRVGNLAGPYFGDENFDPAGSNGQGDPYLSINRAYPLSPDVVINTNYDSKGAFVTDNYLNKLFRYGWRDMGSPPNERVVGVYHGDLGDSYNNDNNSSIRAGEKCLLLAGSNQTSVTWNDNDEEIDKLDPTPDISNTPMLWTPHIGCYNRAVSASADSGLGAADTRGPRQGWLQTSWKQVCAEYTYNWPAPSSFTTTHNNAGGHPTVPVITMWYEHQGFNPVPALDGKMLVGIFPALQEPDPYLIKKTGLPLTGALGPPAVRYYMLAIAPHWDNGLGPSLVWPLASAGPSFSIPADVDFHRISIQFEFVGDPINPLACNGYISASVYVDGTFKAGAKVDKVPGEDNWTDWNRVAFSAGTAPCLFDHTLNRRDTGWNHQGDYGASPTLVWPSPWAATFVAGREGPGLVNDASYNSNPGKYNRYFSCFGLHDQVFLWGFTGSAGTSSYYIQGLRPNDDIGGTGVWVPDSVNMITSPTTNWEVLSDRADPDMWQYYPNGGAMSMPGRIDDYFNNWTANSVVGQPPFVEALVLGYENTEDVEDDWRPANIRGVQQISSHGHTEDDAPKWHIYTTMSIGTTLVDSWPGPQIVYPAVAPDRAESRFVPYANIIHILSTSSYTGNLWTWEELNQGTGSLYATDD